MPVKRRINRRRDVLTEDARAWLEGRDCGFFEFKTHDELIPLLEAYGDPSVATWDKGTHSKPMAISASS
jgi:hypothetical protein